MTTIEEILASNPTQYSNLSMGIKDGLFYYGKMVEHKGQLLEMIVLSNRQLLTNYSSLNTKTDKRPNEINDFGIFYQDLPINIANNDWSNDSITKFISSNSKLMNKKEVYKKVKEQITKYMDLYDERISSMVACWCMGTYIYNLFSGYGYILLTSQKDSGKSKLLKIIGQLSRNSIYLSSPSESVLFRMINGNRPTLLLDDFETLKNEERTHYILQILKIGIDEDGAIPRNEKYKDTFVPKNYNCFCPKALTNTCSLDPITISRCITINLLPTNTEKGKLKPNKRDLVWQEIRDDLHILIMENFQEIIDIYNNESFGDFNSRQLDTTKGLLSIAKFIDDSVYQEVSEFLKESFKDRDLQDLSSDWEYLLFKQLSEKVSNPRWCSIKEINEWLREVAIPTDYNKGFNQYIGSVLSKLSSLFPKQRHNDGIMYLISPKSVQEYMSLKKYPCVSGDSLDTPPSLIYKDEPFRELKDPILDTCLECKERVFVKYTSNVVTGRNLCVSCVECEAKRKRDGFTDKVFGLQQEGGTK